MIFSLVVVLRKNIMSEDSVDLNSTPAESTRNRKAQRTMADKQDRGKNTFKIPLTPSSVNMSLKAKPLKIKSVAERKTDLLSKWFDSSAVANRVNSGTMGNGGQEGCELSEKLVDNNSAISVKLSKYRYDGDGGINK